MCAATGEAGSHNADIVEALWSWRTRAARATIILVFVIVDRLLSETNTLKQIIRCEYEMKDISQILQIFIVGKSLKYYVADIFR